MLKSPALKRGIMASLLSSAVLLVVVGQDTSAQKSSSNSCSFHVCQYRRYASALARLVHRGRESDHKSALHELPPRRRSTHARQRHASAFAARRSRGGRRWRSGQYVRRLSFRKKQRHVRRPGVSFQSVPGHPRWALAPIEMAWEGKSIGEICQQIKDPQRNGGRNLELLHEHLAHDDLVAWGWAPGAGRDPAPGSQGQLGALIRAWIDSGAACP